MTTAGAIIRTSDRGRFKRCRQLWDFESPMRQGYRYTPGIKALDFGIAVHKGLEVYYDPERFENYPREGREWLAKAAFLASCNEHKARILSAQPDMALETETDFEERKTLGLGMLEHYFLWAADHDHDFRPIKSEIEFEVPIPGLDAVYQGRIDMIIEDLSGSYWIVDHKTAAQFGETTYLDLDVQASSYCWAIQKQLNIPINGIIYNEIRKTVPKDPRVNANGSLSKDKNQRTSAYLYRKKLIELGLDTTPYTEYLDHLEQSQNFFRRTTVYRSVAELARVEYLIGLEARDMLDPAVRIYPNPTKFNCQGCAFFTPCLALMDGSDVDWVLNTSGRYAKE